MALDQKEMQALAALVGKVLAPKISEAVAANITVRFEALSTSVREENEQALKAAKSELTKAIEAATDALKKDFDSATLNTKSLTSEAQASFGEHSSALVLEFNGTVEKKIEAFQSTLEAKLAGFNEQLVAATKHVDEQAATFSAQSEKIFADTADRVHQLVDLVHSSNDSMGATVKQVGVAFEALKQEVEHLPTSLDQKMSDAFDLAEQRDQALRTSVSDINLLVSQTREYAGGVATSVEALNSAQAELAETVAAADRYVESLTDRVNKGFADVTGAAELSFKKFTEYATNADNETLSKVDAQLSDIVEAVAAVDKYTEALGGRVDKGFAEAASAAELAFKQFAEFATNSDDDVLSKVEAKISQAAESLANKADDNHTAAVTGIEALDSMLRKSIETVEQSIDEKAAGFSETVRSLQGEVTAKMDDMRATSTAQHVDHIEAVTALEAKHGIASQEVAKSFETLQLTHDAALEEIQAIKVSTQLAIEAIASSLRGELAEVAKVSADGNTTVVDALRKAVDITSDALAKETKELNDRLDKTAKGLKQLLESRMSKAAQELNAELSQIRGSTAKMAERLANERDEAAEVVRSLQGATNHSLDKLAAGIEENEKRSDRQTQELMDKFEAAAASNAETFKSVSEQVAANRDEFDSHRKATQISIDSVAKGLMDVEAGASTSLKVVAKKVDDIHEEWITAWKNLNESIDETNATIDKVKLDHTKSVAKLDEQIVERVTDMANVVRERFELARDQDLSSVAKSIASIAEATDKADAELTEEIAKLEHTVGEVREYAAGFAASIEANAAALREESTQQHATAAVDIAKAMAEFADNAQASTYALQKMVESDIANLRDGVAKYVSESTESIKASSFTVRQELREVYDGVEVLKSNVEQLSSEHAALRTNTEASGSEVAKRVDDLTQQVAKAMQDLQTADDAISAFGLFEQSANPKLAVLDDAHDKLRAEVDEFTKAAKLAMAAHTEGVQRATDAANAFSESLQGTQQQFHDNELLRLEELDKTNKAIAGFAELSTQIMSRISNNKVAIEAEIEGLATTVGETIDTARRELFEHHQKEAEALLQRVSEMSEVFDGFKKETDKSIKSIISDVSTVTAGVPAQVATEFSVMESQFLRTMPGLAETTAEEKVIALFDLATPELQALARTAAIGAVPEAVHAMAEPLREALAGPLLHATTVEATRIATEAGAAAVAAAKALGDDAATRATAAADAAAQAAKFAADDAATNAGTIAAEAATKAAQALRDDLLKVLDPADLVRQAVAAAVPTEVREFVKAEIDDLGSRLSNRMIDKINLEVDRIPRPEPGKDGVDAVVRAMVPVPYEHGEFYKQSDWVAHANGIWVAGRNTDSEPTPDSADWDCVAPGLKAMEALLAADGRTVEFHMEFSNGAFQKAAIKLPIPIQKGIYRADEPVDQYDNKTHDGSQWMALKSGLLDKPGTNADQWKLVTKNGRPGKDLKQPEPAIIRYADDGKGSPDWQADTLYPANVIVRHAGHYWLSLKSNRVRPPWSTLESNEIWLKLGS